MNIFALLSPLRRLRRGQQVTIVLMCVLFLVLSALLSGTYRMNNGDGWRLLRAATVELGDVDQQFQPYPRNFQFLPLEVIKPAHLIPVSSAAAITETAALIQRGLGFDRYDTRWVLWFYLALYLSGITAILLNNRTLVGCSLLVVLINPYILSYFNSPYEDSLLIALIPLLTFLAFETNARGQVVNSWLGLIITASKVQFLLFFLIGLGRTTWRRNVSVILLGALCVGALMIKNTKFTAPNSYNRYFNGLAYSMASVSSWDAYDFHARRELAPEKVSADAVKLPEEAAPYWGTSFWPSGYTLPPSKLAEMSAHFRSWYWSTIFSNPQYAYRVVTEPLFTAFKADYRMNYLFGSSLPTISLTPHSLLMRHLGVVYTLATLCSLVVALYAKQLRFVFYNLFLLGYPILTVYGDGYFELEKHLFPTALLGLVFPLAHLLRTLPSRRPVTTVTPVGITTTGR